MGNATSRRRRGAIRGGVASAARSRRTGIDGDDARSSRAASPRLGGPPDSAARRHAGPARPPRRPAAVDRRRARSPGRRRRGRGSARRAGRRVGRAPACRWPRWPPARPSASARSRASASIPPSGVAATGTPMTGSGRGRGEHARQRGGPARAGDQHAACPRACRRRRVLFGALAAFDGPRRRRPRCPISSASSTLTVSSITSRSRVAAEHDAYPYWACHALALPQRPSPDVASGSACLRSGSRRTAVIRGRDRRVRELGDRASRRAPARPRSRACPSFVAVPA